MKHLFITPFLALCVFMGCGFTAEESGEKPGREGNKAASGEHGEGRDNGRRNRGNWQERLVKDNPELEGVDLQSEEGKAKLREIMMKRGQERIAEGKNQQREALKEQLGFSAEEYEVIKPFLDKVETLRLQQSIVMPSGVQNAFNAMRRGGNRGGDRGDRGDRGNRGGGFDMSTMLLGGQEMDPLASEVKVASEALKTLLDDPQANEEELASAVARVRKSRSTLTAALTKAREELRSVLTVKQEALLTQSGLLD